MGKYFVMLPFFLFLLIGCAPKNTQLAFDGVTTQYPLASRKIVEDAADKVGSIYTPGHDVLFVNIQEDFGKELEKTLRLRGFSINEHGKQIGYKTDIVKNSNPPYFYLTLTMPDGVVSQSYRLSGSTVISDSSITKSGLEGYIDQRKDIYKFNSEQETPSLAIHKDSKEVTAALLDIEKQNKDKLVPTTAKSFSQPVYTPPLASSPLDLPPLASNWQIKPGLLKQQLEQWATFAGYQVVWDTATDYNMQASANFKGDFIDVIEEFFTQMHIQGNPIRVTIYKNNQVIEVHDD